MQATAVADATTATKKKQGDNAVERIERWNLRQYFFNMLQYAAAKHLPWPRIDFTLNGQLLFRLEIDSVDDDDDDNSADDDNDQDDSSDSRNESDAGSGANKSNRLEFLLKYYGAQEQFLDKDINGAVALDAECLANCRFQSLPTDGAGDDQAPAFRACPLDKRFEFVLGDIDAPSKLCYAATFSPLSLAMLDTVLAVVQAGFRSLESRGVGVQSQQFAAAPLWSVERLFYSTLHDAAAVAMEIKGAADESGTPLAATATVEETDGDSSVAALEREWQAAAQEAERAARALCTEKIVSSCQLHADIWQYNEKHRITAIGRQYENLARHERIGDAMHVPFRGAADELQKKIHIGEFLVKMLPTVCCALAAK